MLNIVGAESIMPLMMGTLTHTKPHILNGINTISPTSFVQEFISSTPLKIFCFSSCVIWMLPSGDCFANSLYYLTVFTPSTISASGTVKFKGLVTLKKNLALVMKEDVSGRVSWKLNESFESAIGYLLLTHKPLFTFGKIH